MLMGQLLGHGFEQDFLDALGHGSGLTSKLLVLESKQIAALLPAAMDLQLKRVSECSRSSNNIRDLP